MNKLKKIPRHPSRRKFVTCIAFSALLSTTKLHANDRKDISESIKTAVDTALEKERLKAFYRNIKRQSELLRPLVTKYGEDILKTIRQDTIQRIRHKYANRNIEKRDLDAIKELLWDNLANNKKFQFEILIDTPEELAFKVTKCQWAEAWNKENSADIGFASTCSWDYGFCEGVNPNIEFTRTKTLMQGDCCCNHQYRLKVPSRNHDDHS